MQRVMWPADVISLSGSDGEIRPLRVRTQEGFDEQLIGNISEILRIRQTRKLGAEYHIFLCRVRAKGENKILELKYCVQSHSWYVCSPEI